MNNQNQQINIQLTEKDKLACVCGSDLFDQRFQLFRLPAIVVGSMPKFHIQPVFLCAVCGQTIDMISAKTKHDSEN